MYFLLERVTWCHYHTGHGHVLFPVSFPFELRPKRPDSFITSEKKGPLFFDHVVHGPLLLFPTIKKELLSRPKTLTRAVHPSRTYLKFSIDLQCVGERNTCSSWFTQSSKETKKIGFCSVRLFFCFVLFFLADDKNGERRN